MLIDIDIRIPNINPQGFVWTVLIGAWLTLCVEDLLLTPSPLLYFVFNGKR